MNSRPVLILSPLIFVTTAAAVELYCPSKADFTFGKSVQWNNDGYTVTGSDGVHGKQAFDLTGGFIEYTMDTSRSTPGTNTNFYTSSPDPSYFPSYCDIQANKSPQCMEARVLRVRVC
jgi:hypothetical protein